MVDLVKEKRSFNQVGEMAGDGGRNGGTGWRPAVAAASRNGWRGGSRGGE